VVAGFGTVHAYSSFVAFVVFRLPPPGSARDRVLFGGGAIALLGASLALTLALAPAATHRRAAEPPAPDGPSPSASPAAERPLPAAPPPKGLPVIDYLPAPRGFPADPAPLATVRLTTGLRPTARLGAYDAPGGRARAILAPTIAGVPLTMPIVDRRSGWVAVLLPSANRTVAWVPPGPWTSVPLRDQLVVVRRTHRLTWFRDGAPVRTWPVTLGVPETPTPLGRTFVLGRSTLAGHVYAGTDVFALGAVPDDPDAVPAGLAGAHIGLHTWYHDGDLGRNTTNGCIRLTRSGQRQLLAELVPGTAVVVLDSAAPAALSAPPSAPSPPPSAPAA
jgi:lipoprotein-anchoring transpeptidase ErfK/SrfK